jgi:WD40 repeat protein
MNLARTFKALLGMGLLLLGCGLPSEVQEATTAPIEQPTTELATAAPAPTTAPATPELVIDVTAIPSNLARIRPSSAHLLRPIASYSQSALKEIVFAPDMTWVALITWDGVYLLDWPSLQPVQVFVNEDERDFPFAISEDGTALAWRVRPTEVQVVELPTGSSLLSLSGIERCCEMIALSPSGDTLALMDGNSARVWSIPSGQETFTVEGVIKISISADGQMLATTSNRALSVSIWDLLDGEFLRDLTGFSTAAPDYYTLFSPDWETMVWLTRASMQFTHVPSGNLGPDFIGSWGVYSPDGEVLAVVESGWYGDDFLGDVMLIDPSNAEQLGVLEHEDKPRKLRFSSDGSMLAVAVQDTFTLWDTSGWDKLISRTNPYGEVQNLFFSPDGRLLVSLARGSDLEFWGIQLDPTAINPLNAEFVEEIAALEIDGPTDVAIAPTGNSLAIATQHGDLEIWDWELRQIIQMIPAHEGWIYRVRYSPTGEHIATASLDGTLKFWEALSGELVSELDPRGGEATSLAFSSDGESFISGHEDGALRLWEIAGTGAASSLEGHTDWIWGTALSPNGQMAASASADGTARLWELASGSELHVLAGHASAVWDVAFSPDGSLIATSSWDGSILLWEVASGAPVTALRGHTDWVYGIAFAPNGSLLASASKDGTVRLWDVASGLELHMLEGHSDRVWSVAFSPDGSMLASASSDGTVRLWGYVP